MDDTELQSIVRADIDDAISFIDSEVGRDRALALDYYHGRPFGDEEEGRSQVVSRDVHDTINAALPSLMRVFFGSENVVEFAPEGAEDVPQAEQATDYVNYVITQDNDGFGVFYAAIKDALRSKVGFIKYWWDDSVAVTTKTYTGLDEMGLAGLLEDLQKSLEAEIVESSQEAEGLTVTLRLKRKCDRVKIAAVPPEELLIDRKATSLETARLVAHRTIKTVSDLVAMGYDREEIEAASAGDELEGNEERLARNPWSDGGDDVPDPAMRELLYVEAYRFVDFDGDGIAELRKICTVGAGHKVLHNEPWDERPFADLHCDPEPHTFFGQSLADKTMDVQRIKSVMLRAAMDAMAQSIYPRTVVIEALGGVVEDAMNTEVGAILRARAPGAYEPLVTPDLSGSALPFLSYMDELRENRTGMSKVSMGLDAEALQSTTATAAEGQFTRSQERIELIARIMASGVRKLFRGVLRLIGENQRAQRVVKLRNQWVPVDPRAWNTNMDVVCTVGMGGGTEQQKAQLLALVAQKQEQIIQLAGPHNPLASLKNYHNTLSKLVELGGIRNPDAYFSDPESPEAQQRAANAPPPPPDPKVVETQAKMQLEQQKAQVQAQLDQQKAQTDLELRRMELEADLALKREQIAAELELKREQLAAEIQLKRELGLVQAEVARETGMVKAAASTATSDVEPGGEPG